MRRLIGIPLAAGLLILAATAVLAGNGSAPAAGKAAGTVTGTVAIGAERAISILEDVLSGLVDDGTITEDQSAAIVAAIEAKAEELRAEHEALREERQALREQLQGFLEDGTISADELAQLPEDHPLRNLDEFLEDGQLTADELRELRGFGLRGPHGGGHFWRHGGGDHGDDSDGDNGDGDGAEESPAPAAGS